MTAFTLARYSLSAKGSEHSVCEVPAEREGTLDCEPDILDWPLMETKKAWLFVQRVCLPSSSPFADGLRSPTGACCLKAPKMVEKSAPVPLTVTSYKPFRANSLFDHILSVAYDMQSDLISAFVCGEVA